MQLGIGLSNENKFSKGNFNFYFASEPIAVNMIFFINGSDASEHRLDRKLYAYIKDRSFIAFYTTRRKFLFTMTEDDPDLQASIPGKGEFVEEIQGTLKVNRFIFQLIIIIVYYFVGKIGV